MITKNHSDNPNHTHQSEITFCGCNIQSWYDESSASPFAWMAFVSGFGTSYGSSEDEAVDYAKSKIKATQISESELYISQISGLQFESEYHNAANRIHEIKPNESLSSVVRKIVDRDGKARSALSSDPAKHRAYRHLNDDITEAARNLASVIQQNLMTHEGENKEFKSKLRKIKGQNAVGLVAAIAAGKFHTQSIARDSEFNLIGTFAGYAKGWRDAQKQASAH